MIISKPTDLERAKLERIATAKKWLPFLVVPLAFSSPIYLLYPNRATTALAITVFLLMLAPVLYLSFFLRCPRCAGWIAMPKCPSCGLKLDEPPKRPQGQAQDLPP